MTKTNIMLYFKNKYIYNTVISMALFLATIPFVKLENLNLFVCLLSGFYGFDVLVKLHDLHISLRHRVISVYPETFKLALTEIVGFNILKVLEFSIYVTVAFSIYQVNGFLFVLNCAVLMFAIIRIILTVLATVYEIREEWKYHREPLAIPEEFKHYITKNRILTKRIGDSIDFPKKTIDNHVEIFVIEKPNQMNLGYRKTPVTMEVLKYNNNLYDIKNLNIYIDENNKNFKTLTKKELQKFKI